MGLWLYLSFARWRTHAYTHRETNRKQTVRQELESGVKWPLSVSSRAVGGDDVGMFRVITTCECALLGETC